MSSHQPAVRDHLIRKEPGSSVEYIDLATWDRRPYFMMYLGTDFPYISIGANIDVTNLLAFSRSQGLSSYITMVFACHHTAEDIVNFRYRIVDGRPIVNGVMRPSFTHIPEGHDLFINVTIDYIDDLFEFHRNAKRKILIQGNELGISDPHGTHDIIMYSAVPWIQYTHFIRTIAKLGVDSNPKISWGKYFAHGDRTLVPFSVQVHHGLMDGIHVGRYFEALQRYIDELSL